MTTIVSTPFKEGVVVISDTRATDHRYHQYIAYDKVSPMLGYTISDNVSFYIGGAGASIGTESVIYPFLKYLQKKSAEFCVNLSTLDLPQFVEYINNLSGIYISKEALPTELSLAEHCAFLIIIKTPKFLAVFKSNYLGGLCITVDSLHQYTEQERKNPNNASLFEGVGSGSMYILGALLLQNQISPLHLKEEEEIVNWAKKYFKQGIIRDLGSSTENGLNIRIIYRDSRESKNIRV